MLLRQKLFRCGQLCCTNSISSLNTEQQMQHKALVSHFPLLFFPLKEGLLCLFLQAGRSISSLGSMQNKPQLLQSACALEVIQPAKYCSFSGATIGNVSSREGKSIPAIKSPSWLSARWLRTEWKMSCNS